MYKQNFFEVLQQHADNESKNSHIFLNPRKNAKIEISHSTLIRKAFGLSHWLQEQQVKPGDICYIVSVSQYTQLLAFYAAVAAGAKPLIGAHLPKFGAESDTIAKVNHWKNSFGEKLKILSDNDILIDDISIISLAKLETISEHTQPAVKQVYHEDDILYLQSSSATTGKAKAITVSHRNCLTNVKQIKAGLAAKDNEIFVSWLPLYHDMGLVGAELFSLCYDYSLILIPPYEFTRKPSVWLDAISHYRGTITAIPAFAIDYVMDMALNPTSELDLSSLHSICIGAEPVRMHSIEKFMQIYADNGLSQTAFVPCYGLAESTLAATFKPARENPKSVYLQQYSIKQGEQIVLSNDNDPHALRITSVGKVVAEVNCYIEYENQPVTQELICGEICLSGPSITQGYMQNPDLISLLPSNILKTGDVGFIHESELYILDRDKNIIILNGVNYVASEIESFIACQLTIQKRQIIVFENKINDLSKQVVAVIEIKQLSDINPSITLDNIFKNTIIDEIIIVKRGFIEVTSSGKKRYFIARQKYQKKDFKLFYQGHNQFKEIIHECEN